MLDRKLKEALELLGGKAIVSEQGEYFVIMTLKEFKKLKQDEVGGLTKQELIDKINNDIAVWQVSQEEEKLSRLNLEEIEQKKEKDSEEIRYGKA